MVVGGGITGLAAAWEARDRARVTVLEASERLGGRIHDTEVGGVPVAGGPDAFLARVPWATQLCREVGLGDDLISPSRGGAFVWSRGRLRALPGDLAIGVPTRLASVARSGILSPAELLRAGMDLVRPATPPAGDESVGAVVRRRFGAGVTERLVGPLIGGINAGDIDRLSIEAAVPQIADAARAHRSLLLGLRRQRREAPEGPVFHSVRGGLTRLVEQLADQLAAAGVDIQTGAPVDHIEAVGAGVAVRRSGGEGLEADRVLLTTPAPVTARLIEGASADAATGLQGIRHASVALVLLAVAPDALPSLDGAGLLVPRVEGRLATAVTFWTSKWGGAPPPSPVVLRVSVGRIDDDRAITLSDHDLLAGVLADLGDILGLRGEPLDHRIVRWPESFPQYEPGHFERVATIERALARDVPAVQVAGAAFRGVGIPACVRQGREAAAALLEAA